MIPRMLFALGVAAGASAATIDPGPVMTIGRLHYDGGGDWYANPSSLPNLLSAIRTRTTLRVATEEKQRRLAHSTHPRRVESVGSEGVHLTELRVNR